MPLLGTECGWPKDVPKKRWLTPSNPWILAYEFESAADKGIGLRVQGQAQWANHQRGEALDSFEKSLAILADRDPYESARTKVEWAKCLRSEGNVEQSIALLQQAKSAFEKLGAQRDLADLDGLSA